MESDFSNKASEMRQVYLIPPDFEQLSKELLVLSGSLEEEARLVALSFVDGLRGILRTLSLPFQFIHAQVHSLQWERLYLAELIRAGNLDDESAKESVAVERAQIAIAKLKEETGGVPWINAIIDQLHQLSTDPEQAETSRELLRQGVVLLWSTFEVLARDTFVLVLNRKPEWSGRIYSSPTTRKRFESPRLDWETLSSHGFDISGSLGTILASRTDLDDIRTIRDSFGALFPEATELGRQLADARLWTLYQRRNLIVHRRGIVDEHYRTSTGEDIPIGQRLVVVPSDIESLLDSIVLAGQEMLREVARNLPSAGSAG